MGLQAVPAFISQSGFNHPAELMRNLVEQIAGGRSGPTRPGYFAVTPTGVAQQLSISAGGAVIVGQENAQQGAYFAWSDVAETKTATAPSGSPRIDTLLLRIYDPQYGTIGGVPRAEWEIVAGTPSGSPVARTNADFLAGGGFYQPGAWWRCCDFRVNPGDTVIPGGQIYPTLTFARTAGHTWGNAVASTTGFGGFPTDAVDGDTFDALDQDCRFRYNGSLWVPQAHRVMKTKSGNQSAPISSITLIDDNDLFFDAPANSVWEIREYLWYTAGGAGDLRIGHSFSGTATFTWNIGGLAASVLSNVGDMYVGNNNLAGSDIVAGFNSSTQSARPAGILKVGATGGTFKVRFAQGTSDTFATTLLTDSTLIADRLA